MQDCMELFSNMMDKKLNSFMEQWQDYEDGDQAVEVVDGNNNDAELDTSHNSDSQAQNSAKLKAITVLEVEYIKKSKSLDLSYHLNRLKWPLLCRTCSAPGWVLQSLKSRLKTSCYQVMLQIWW